MLRRYEHVHNADPDPMLTALWIRSALFLYLDADQKNLYHYFVFCIHMALKESDRRSYMLGLQMAGDFGANLAVPVVALVLLGKWLQNKFGFAPFGVIAGFVIAAWISYSIIRRKVEWYAAEYKALENSDKK